MRFTAEGTDEDPGPRVVHAGDLGALALIVAAADSSPGDVADVQAVQRAAAGAPWMLATLHAVATTGSLRQAARQLHVHHSTLHDRLAHAEADLGWGVRDVGGGFRLQLALHLRRVLRAR